MRVLRVLAAEPERWWTERELAARTHGVPNTINVAVRHLRDHGLLEFLRIGTSNAVRLRPGTLTTQRLMVLFEAEANAWQAVRDVIRQAAPKKVACLLYGSTSRREARKDSDVDVLVVGPTKEEAEEASAHIRSCVSKVFPLDLSLASVGKRELKRRQAAWLGNALHGQLLTKTRVEDVA